MSKAKEQTTKARPRPAIPVGAPVEVHISGRVLSYSQKSPDMAEVLVGRKAYMLHRDMLSLDREIKPPEDWTTEDLVEFLERELERTPPMAVTTILPAWLFVRMARAILHGGPR